MTTGIHQKYLTRTIEMNLQELVEAFGKENDQWLEERKRFQEKQRRHKEKERLFKMQKEKYQGKNKHIFIVVGLHFSTFYLNIVLNLYYTDDEF